MKIKIISECLINGQHQNVGAIVEVNDATARMLVGIERAVPVREEAKPAKPEHPAKGGK